MTNVSNHTESDAKKLRKRFRYISKHCVYLDYLRLLLDRASLPASTFALPNTSNMAALSQELRELYPHIPDLNHIVLGRVLNRVLPSVLTWHGGQHAMQVWPRSILLIMETTIYRFPEVGRGRTAFESFAMRTVRWRNDLDQWQCTTLGDE
jgi:hypothetical protein